MCVCIVCIMCAFGHGCVAIHVRAPLECFAARQAGCLFHGLILWVCVCVCVEFMLHSRGSAPPLQINFGQRLELMVSRL